MTATVEQIGIWWGENARGSPRVVNMESSIIAAEMKHNGVFLKHTPQLENQSAENLLATHAAAAKLKQVHGNTVSNAQAVTSARAW